jgi:hypothetical protein
MKPETAGKVKFGVWGLIVGAIIAMIIGFAWGGWTTSGDPNYEEKFKEFRELSTYQRFEFIQKGGWDKMPGQEKAGNSVARPCADGLELLIKE